MKQRISRFLELKNRPWEWIFSGIGVFVIGGLLTWLWDGELTEPSPTNIAASDGSIVSGGDTIVTASGEDSIAIVATGPVTVNNRDLLVSEALEVLERRLAATEKLLVASLKREQQDQTRVGEFAGAIEARFPKQYQELTNAVEAISKLTGLTNAQPRIDEALSEAVRGNTKPAEAIFLEVEKKKLSEGRGRVGKQAAAEAARHRGALVLLHDPVKALAAYRRANELDPDIETQRLIEFSEVILILSKLEESSGKLEHEATRGSLAKDRSYPGSTPTQLGDRESIDVSNELLVQVIVDTSALVVGLSHIGAKDETVLQEVIEARRKFFTLLAYDHRKGRGREATLKVISTNNPRIVWVGKFKDLMRKGNFEQLLSSIELVDGGCSDLQGAFEEARNNLKLGKPKESKLYVFSPLIHTGTPCDKALDFPVPPPEGLDLKYFIDRVEALKFFWVHPRERDVWVPFLEKEGITVQSDKLHWGKKGQTSFELLDRMNTGVRLDGGGL